MGLWDSVSDWWKSNVAGKNDAKVRLNRTEQGKELDAAMQERAMGRGGPSVAEQQLKSGMESAQAASASQAASARGGNLALAQREAQRSQAAMTSQAARDATILRSQEQMDAQNAQIANLNAQQGLGVQAQTAMLQAGETSAQRRQGLFGAAASALASMSDERTKEPPGRMPAWLREYAAAEGLGKRARPVERDAGEADDGTWWGYVGRDGRRVLPRRSAGAAERAHEDEIADAERMIADAEDLPPEAVREARSERARVAAGDEPIPEWLREYRAQGDATTAGDAAAAVERLPGAAEIAARASRDPRGGVSTITPRVFRYRMGYADEAAELTRARLREPRAGVMAQDLERDPVGNDVVTDTPAGKALDRDKAIGLALAAIAKADKRIARLERGGAR